LTYSTWEVNPPNPTGYSPQMMVTCMNDPGTGPTPDPYYNPQYSNFCYEIPFMPGATQYMDTPVTPTSAFAGAGYNNVDCSYPTGTPAIKEVDGDGVGPWVSAAGHSLTITALGNQTVPNYAYSGPSATTAPYNAKTITRDYGFGTRGTVTIGGVNATITGWSTTTITVNVPGTVPNCSIQQQAQYGGSTARCGELVITRGDGTHRQSIDAVTVTIGGKAPTHVAATDSVQAKIDAAQPGDMLIIDPTCTTATGVATACTTPSASNVHSNSSHLEMLLMWKPVRLQGVGAASSILNANSHPSGKLQAWRERVNCLFGLQLNGSPITATNSSYDPTGAVSCPGTGWFGFTPTANNPQVDRLPLEAVVGWDAELNGNLAEQLQEPSLMGALEGAAITVLAKGVNFPSNPYDPALLAGFPTGTTLLQNTIPNPSGAMCNVVPNPFPSNYSCNPSSIDGLGITNSSQGGGGIFVHGWGHNLQIANNRITNNSGTLSGGINLGQGEYPPAYIEGAGILNAAPGSCEESPVANTVLPYCHDVNVNIHNNDIALDSSTGDELFSGTPAGAGGVSICTGSDYYKFNYNWVCGNLSTGDGGGLGHLGFSYDGDIEHNSILFNQSLNPTIPANGGGIIVMGTPDADIVCNGNALIDQDCVPYNAANGTGNPLSTPIAAVGPSDGVGPGLVINANLIMGNAAEAGSGGGIAFQAVNGSDVVSFPSQPSQWNRVTVTNNIIADNVAGWDGAGISLVDSVNVNIVNNTIVSNTSTASSGVLFTTLGGPIASTQGPNCMSTTTTSCPQVGGLVAIQHSAILSANIGPLTVTCPTGHPNCKSISTPKLENNIFWQNSSYYIGVGSLGAGPLNQQNVVALYNSFTSTLAPTQSTTGACVARSYWDIGVRGDTGPTNHNSTFTLGASDSVLTPGGSAVTGSGNVNGNPNFISQYCDGSRTPPEFGASGFQVPPGISDATVPNPIFNLTPVATVDEGNNWVNMRWGPLSLLNPVTSTTTTNVVLGNYGMASQGSAFGLIHSDTAGVTNCADAPALDFFNNAKKTGTSCATGTDAGAVEFLNGSAASSGAGLTLLPAAVDFGGQALRTTSTDQDVVVVNSGNAPVTITNGNISFSGTNPLVFRQTNDCVGTLGVGQSCIINVVFAPGLNGSSAAAGPKSANLNVTAGGSTQTVALTGSTTVATAGFSAPAPLLTTTPATLAAKTGTITVTNTATGANAGSFTLTANPTVTRTGANHGNFTIAAGGTCVTGVVVAPGGTCTIAVTYTPTNLTGGGTSTGHVTIAGTGLATSPVNGPNFNGN
jgi:hypothetical protein